MTRVSLCDTCNLSKNDYLLYEKKNVYIRHIACPDLDGRRGTRNVEIGNTFFFIHNMYRSRDLPYMIEIWLWLDKILIIIKIKYYVYYMTFILSFLINFLLLNKFTIHFFFWIYRRHYSNTIKLKKHVMKRYTKDRLN